jgi:hypothetical protein
MAFAILLYDVPTSLAFQRAHVPTSLAFQRAHVPTSLAFQRTQTHITQGFTAKLKNREFSKDLSCVNLAFRR